MDKPDFVNLYAIENILKIFPYEWRKAFEKVNLKDLCEIRIRVAQPILLRFLNNQCFLGKNGIVLDKQLAVLPSKEEVEEIVFLACNKSVYAYIGQLLNGFLPYLGGTRIGVCGEVVLNNEKIISLKNFSSINIRIPHEIKNCSFKVKKYFSDPLKSVLVVSRPSCGKTTFLRDMIYQLRDKKINTLIVDEREELSGIKDGKSSFALNDTCDVLTNCSKKFAFEWGIRSMSPELIVCDEIFKNDLDLIKMVAQSGVKIFASIHADSVFNALTKLELSSFEAIFDFIVLLSDRLGAGTIEGVFDEKLERVL